MSGYKWDPVFRVVPVNGSETVYWLADRLTDCGGHNRIVLRYVESQNIREDINRSLRPVVFGLRPEVEIECQIFSMADQFFLAEIESALLQPRDYAVYLSLDGGVVERQVVLSRVSNPEPLAGKTIVGAVFRLGLRCVDLIATKPAMMTDPGTGEELTQNGGFEGWTGGVPDGWNGSSGVGTVAQETTIINPGGSVSSAKVTRSDAVTSFLFTQSLKRVPKQGAWYRYRGYVRSSVDLALSGSGAYRVALMNNAGTLYVASDGKTWSASGNLILGASLSASFTQYEAYFRMPTTIKDADGLNLRHQGYWASGESLYYDDESVYGPVLRTGYATW